MKLLFMEAAWQDYLFLQANDRALLTKLNGLIQECSRTPFTGTGKPEPLKRDLAGWWSRRMNHADRLIYRVRGTGDDQVLEIAQCRFHYTR